MKKTNGDEVELKARTEILSALAETFVESDMAREMLSPTQEDNLPQEVIDHCDPLAAFLRDGFGVCLKFKGNPGGTCNDCGLIAFEHEGHVATQQKKVGG